MGVNENIKELRKLMENRGIDAYIVPTDDFHGSEYVGDYFKERQFITGFTGSAGTAVIFRSDADGAYLWVDGRYFLQAEMQLKGTAVTEMRMGEPGVSKLTELLAEKLSDGAVLGFDGRTVTQSLVDEMDAEAEKHGKKFAVHSEDLIDLIWKGRPQLSKEPAAVFDVKYSGLGRKEKIADLKERVENEGGELFVMTTLDDIAWLLNIRGNDVKCNPVVLSFFVLDAGKPVLFAQGGAIAPVKAQLEADGVEVREYNEVYDYIKNRCEGRSVILDKTAANYEIIRSCEKAGKVESFRSYYFIKKYLKNPTEIEGMAYAHLKDGVAKTKWIYWVKQNVAGGKLSELSVADKLFELRMAQENCRGNSFEPIMGYGPHGAIIHYEATPEEYSMLRPKGFLLADTGGQYLEGTTDVTRTIALGELTEEQKRDYTAVLRGHLRLQHRPFKYGTKGSELDKIAREPLHEVCGYDYNHGTGHGVGVYLNVHENPVRITKGELLRVDDLAFEEGMITSNEPGIYIEGKHGVRIENLEVCLSAGKDDAGNSLLKFEPLTLIPYEPEALDLKQMTDEEIRWFNEYQALVFEKISPYLDKDEKAWLEKVTKPVKR